MNQLVFNTDGTIDPEQLAGFPDEVRKRLSSPDFIAMAREQIRNQTRVRTGRRESRREVRVLRTTEPIRKHVRLDGVSGRQLKKMRKIARRIGGNL